MYQIALMKLSFEDSERLKAANCFYRKISILGVWQRTKYSLSLELTIDDFDNAYCIKKLV